MGRVGACGILADVPAAILGSESEATFGRERNIRPLHSVIPDKPRSGADPESIPERSR